MPKGLKGFQKGNIINRGRRHSEEYKRKRSEWQKGRHHSEETKRKMSEALKGKMPKNINLLHSKKSIQKRRNTSIGHLVSQETRRKISLSRIGDKNWSKRLDVRKKMSEARIGRFKGEKCHLWKGGITPENQKVRTSIEFRLWRESVFARDNWTCQKCLIRGINLHSHHIRNFAEEKELRCAIDNGMTLCKKCHKEFHKIYGRKNNTKEQINVFIGLKARSNGKH